LLHLFNYFLFINLVIVTLLVFLLNIPFGMWRANTKKFSWKWFLSIHIPIPFIVGLRFLFNLGFELYTYPILVTAFFLGQLFGKKIEVNKKTKNSDKE